MRFPVTITCILFTLGSAYAQFSMENFLATAMDDGEVKVVKNQVKFTEENNFVSPVIREVELRFRDTRFTEGMDDYRFRVSPINPLERMANRQFGNALQNQKLSELQLELNNALKRRYELLLEHFDLSQRLDLLDRRLAFYGEIQDLVRVNPERFSMKDMIDLDRKVLEVALDAGELEGRIRQTEYLVHEIYPFTGELSWEGIELTDMNQLKQWHRLETSPGLEGNLFIRNELEKLKVQESLLKVNRRESFNNLGFLQAEYRTDYDNPFSHNLGFQVGLTLPIVNPDKPDLNRREIELMESLDELETDRQEIRTTAGLRKIYISSLFERYDIIQTKADNYLDFPISSDPDVGSIEMLMELRDYQYELLALRHETYMDILSVYMDVLAGEGKLSARPGVNYLSYDKAPFDLGY